MSKIDSHGSLKGVGSLQHTVNVVQKYVDRILRRSASSEGPLSRNVPTAKNLFSFKGNQNREPKAKTVQQGKSKALQVEGGKLGREHIYYIIIII